MGVYLNPSAADFSEKVGKKTFVDKTELLKDICDRVNDPDRKYVAVSRPRRFGKTTDANMLVAWFGRKDHSSLFRNLKISECSDRYQKYQNGFDVIKADMSKGTFRFSCIRDYIEDLDQRILREISLEKKTEALMENDSLSACLDRIFAATGEQFIVVLDEWDAPLRLFPDDMPGHLYYAGWLNDLLKGKDYLALVYMTGILPIKKYGDDSFMNMFDEISMIDPGDFAPY
ncbi:MAG: AAA family ATPase, partial [Solobacterium sp.]|nr:AAA family ATPase [Solobacterium sp.]